MAITIENPILGFSLIAVGLIAFWILFSALCYYSSGWSRFRKLYGVRKVATIETWPLQSAKFIGPFNLFGFFGIYRHMLTFGYCNEGIFVSGMPFTLFHKPFVIPWNDAILTVIDGYCLASVRLPQISIMIPKMTYDGIIGSGRVENAEGLGI